jgi:hypothetical protein
MIFGGCFCLAFQVLFLTLGWVEGAPDSRRYLDCATLASLVFVVCATTFSSVSSLVRKINECEDRIAKLEGERRLREAAPRDERIVRLDGK